MPRFMVEIDMDDDAMLTVEQVADALEDVVGTLRGVGDVMLDGIRFGEDTFDARGGVRDENGNTVGEWTIA